MSPCGLVIVGGGQAGLQLASSARAAGFGEEITIVSCEPEAPYQRPPLSKAYLLGKHTREQLALQKPVFFEMQRIGLSTGRFVVRVDRAASRVELDDGSRLTYGRLAFATGARNRTLDVEGRDLRGVFGLRDVQDADRLREAIASARRVVVVGGGFIGLEFAAVARQLGRDVLVVEAQARLMARAVPTVVSEFFLALHQSRGVRFAMGDSVTRFQGESGRVTGVVLGCDRVEPADLVVVGIGVVPNDELASACGLRTDRGIVVDETLTTSDPQVVAVGDCVALAGPGSKMTRLESVQNAIDQAKHAARTVTGSREPYSALPWFWSDQYDVKLQIAGLAQEADRTVLRGDPSTGRFSAFSFRAGRLVGVDSINQPLDHAVARRMLSGPCHLTPEQAQDLAVDLRGLSRSLAA